MDNELLTLTVQLDDGQFTEKAESIEDKIEQIKKKSEDFRPGGDTASIPGYNQAMNTRFDQWIDNLNHIAATSRAYEKASTQQERDALGASYKRQVEVAKAGVKDLISSTAMAKNLTASVEKTVTETFNEGLKGVFTQLGNGLKQTAMSMAGGLGKLSDGDIVARFMESPQYKSIMGPRQSAHPNAFSSQRMEQYLTSQLPIYVPQYMRASVTGGSAVAMPQKAITFRGLFPESFKTIPTAAPAQRRILGALAGDNTPLTQDEISALQKIVETDRLAQDAAVRAGLYAKSNGGLYRNPNLTRGHINAMSGFVFGDASTAVMGERKFGMTNPDDPSQWRKVERKIGNNIDFDSGRRTAHALHDAYGSWINPGYYDRIQPFNPNHGTGIYTGPITMAPRRRTSAYAEYTLDMMEGGAQINGANPVYLDRATGKWRTAQGITKPTTSGGKRFSPDDFHTVTLASSLENDILSQMTHSSRAGQNEFNDNAIYLKYDSKWSDPYLKDEDSQRYQADLAKRIREGYVANGHHYSFTRAGKTHAEFMRDDLIEDLGRYELGLEPKPVGSKGPVNEEHLKAGLKLLANGASMGSFNEYKPFAKSLYNQNLPATEGENLRTLWGIPFGFSGNATTEQMLADPNLGQSMRDKIMRDYGTPNVKVVVGNFGKDMDGANWGSARLFNEGGQGRSYGGKATYVRMDLNALKTQYPDQIVESARTAEEIAKIGDGITEQQRRDIMNRYGDFRIQGAGINGEDLIIPWDTDIIEDVNNIKNFNQMFAGMTPEEINDMRSRQVSRFGISLKTTYGKSNTSGRWLSKQLVNGPMNAGFSDPVVDAYFNKIFMDEMTRLSTDDQYIRRELFGGDQTVDLTSEESQNIIRGHLSSMVESYSEGNRLLPHGVYSWNMAAPAPINVVNNALRKAGVKIPKEMEELELGNNDVISLGSMFDQLGIVRHPATISGNIVASNLARDKSMAPKIQKMAEQLGMDPKALYFRPGSPILEALQGEDFDGDINGLFGLSGKGSTEFNQMMARVFQISNEDNAKIWKMAGRTPEEQAALKESVKSKGGIKRADKPFDMRNPEDIALYIMEQAKNTPMMGRASRTMDVMSLLRNPKISTAAARAILDLESNYDVVSVHGKTGDTWEDTPDQKAVKEYGRSFGNIFNWVGKSLDSVYEDGQVKQVWTDASQERLNKYNIDELAFPTMSSGSLTGQLLTRMYAQNFGLPAAGTNPDGSLKYDWDTIFDNLPAIKNPESATGRFTQAARDVKRNIATGRYLAPSQEEQDFVTQLQKAAEHEIDKQLIDEGITDINAYAYEYDRKAREAGIFAWRDYLTENGLRRENVEKDDQTKAMVSNVANAIGVPVDALFGSAPVMPPTQTPPVTQPPKQAQQPSATPARIAETQQKPKQTPKTPAEVKAGFPEPQEQVPFEVEDILENIAAKQPETTAREEAKEILRNVLGKGKSKDALIDSVMGLPETDLLSAINEGNLDPLLKIKGIGTKTAQKITQALAGSRFAQIQRGGSLEPNIANVNVPDMTAEIQKAEQQIEAQQEVAEEASKITEAQTEIIKTSAEQKAPQKSANPERDALEAQRKKLNGWISSVDFDPSWAVNELKKVIETDEQRPREELESFFGKAHGKTKEEYLASRRAELKDLEEYQKAWNDYMDKHPDERPVPLKTEQSTSEHAGMSDKGYQPTAPNQYAQTPVPPVPPTTPPGWTPNAPSDSMLQLAQAQFAQLIQPAQEFSNKLFGQILRSEQQLKDVPQSLIDFNRNNSFARSHERKLQNFKNSALWDTLAPDQKTSIDRLLDSETGLVAKAGRDFSDSSVVRAHNLLESITEQDSKINGTYDAQVEALDAWDKKIKELSEDQQQLFTLSKDQKYGKNLRDQFTDDAKAIGKDLDEIKKKRDSILGGMQKQNQTAFSKQLDSLESHLMPQNKLEQAAKQYSEQIAAIRENVTKKHDAGLMTDEDYNKDIERLDEFAKQATTTSLATKQLFTTVESSLGRVMQRFGRQIFNKAVQETKKFVKEFNASMVEIQAITMKTDDQMSDVRSRTLQTAVDLHTSVSNVSSTEAALYRQGLTDEEVQARTEDVIKFSQVAGIKVEAATKIITTALQNNLVDSSTEAMDALVALGDNAATTADEIGKAMQKSAASAKVAGVSYEELVSMATVMTSMTQLSGTQVGTAMNTIFSRIRKVTTEKFVRDQNGETTSLSDVETALGLAGIDLYTDESRANYRSATDILRDIAAGWQNMSDVQKSNITSAIAGTRMTNMFTTLMEGIGEDGGAKFEELLGLAGDSEGITESKYQVIAQGLAASFDTLRSSWDQLVAGLESNDVLTGSIDFISGLIQGITALNGVLGGSLSAILAVGAAVAAVTTIIATSKIPGIGAPLAIGAGVAVAAGVMGIGGLIGKGLSATTSAPKIREVSAQEQYDNFTEKNKDATDKYKSLIAKAETLGKKYDETNGNLSTSETDALTSALASLQAAFSGVDSSVSSAASGLDSWKSTVSAAKEEVQKLDEANKKSAKTLADIAIGDAEKEYAEKTKEINESTPTGLLFNGELDQRVASVATAKRGDKDALRTIASNFAGLEMAGMTEQEIVTSLFGTEGYDKYVTYMSGDSSSVGGYEERREGWLHQLAHDGNKPDGSSTAVALGNILGYQGLIDYKGNNISSNQETAQGFDSLVASLYQSNALEKVLSTQDWDELTRTYGTETNTFLSDFKAGFKNTKLSAGLPWRLAMGIARVVAGDVDVLTGYEDVRQEQLDKEAEGLLDTYLANNTDIRFSDTPGLSAAIKNRLLENHKGEHLNDWVRTNAAAEIQAEVESAENNPNYVEENTPSAVTEQSPQDIVTAAYKNIKPKDRKYDREYAGLYHLLTSKDIADITNEDVAFANALELINSGSDTELINIWESVNSGKGRYTQKDLTDYLFNQVYGSTPEELTATNMNTAAELGLQQARLTRMNDWQMLELQPNESDIQTIASALKIDPNQVRQNYATALNAYNQSYSTARSQFEQSIYDQIEKGYGLSDYFNEETGVYENVPKETIAKIQEQYSPLGFDIRASDKSGVSVNFVGGNVSAGAARTDFTPVYTNRELRDRAAEIAESGLNYNEAAERYKFWDDSLWNAVMDYSPELAQYMKMSPGQQASEEGQALKRAFELQFKVEGIADLEQAGKILEGTTRLIEDLSGDNTVKIADALREITTASMESGQQTAKLYSGTYSQVNEAAMSILGITDENVFLQNRDMYVQQARERQQLGRTAQASTYEQELVTSQTEEARQQIIQAAQTNGYRYENGTFVYDESLINLNRMRHDNLVENAREVANENDLQSIYRTANSFVPHLNRDYYTPEGYGIPVGDVFDTLLGADFNKLYENDQVWKDMVNLGADFDSFTGYISRMSNGQPGNVAQNYGWALQQAFGTADITSLTAQQLEEGWTNAGPQLQEVLSRTFDQMAGGDIFKSVATRQSGDLTAARDAYNNWLLEQGRFDSLESNMAYQQVQYDISNRTQNAATSLFSVLSQGQNFDNFGDFINSVGSSQVDNWKALLDSSPELANKMKDLGFSFEGDALDFTGEAESFKSALAALAAAVAEASNQITDVTTHGEDLRRAQEYLATGNRDYYDEFESALGDSDLAARARNDIEAQMAANQVQADAYEEAYKQNYGTNRAEANRILAEAEAAGFMATRQNGIVTGFTGGTITPIEDRDVYNPYELEYYNMRMANASNGFTGLTENQKFYGANLLLDQMRAGNLTGENGFYMNNSKAMIADYASMLPENYLNAAMAVEQAASGRYTMATIGDITQDSPDYEAVSKAVEEYYGSLQGAQKAQKDLDAEWESKSVKLSNKLGDHTDEAAEAMANFAKGGKDAIRQSAAWTKSIKTLQNNLTAVSKMRGKKPGQVGAKEGGLLAQFLGLDDWKDVQKLTQKQFDEALDAMEKDAQETFSQGHFKPMLEGALTDINQAISENKITLDQVVDVVTQVNESGDLSAFIALLESIESDYVAAAESMAGDIATIMIDIIKSIGAEHGQIDVEASVSSSSASANTPSGYSGGGGGGGGGGKSDAQKLIERQKHEIDRLKHNLTMIQTNQSHYDFMNDYDAYDASLQDEQVAIQNMQSAYAGHIQELQDQLAGTEYDSEDYWALTDALHAAEEAMADLQNSLDELRNKIIQQIEEQHQNEMTPEQHVSSLLEKRANRYQMLGQTENWISIQNQSRDQNDFMISVLKDQEKDWIKQMKNSTFGDESWIAARDNLLEIREQIADLQNDNIQKWIDVNNAMVTEVGKDLEHAQATAVSDANLYGTGAEMAQRANNGWVYRGMLNQQNTAYASQLDDLVKARDEMQSVLDQIEREEAGFKDEFGFGLQDHTDAWYDARDSVDAYEESILNVMNTMAENKAAWQQSVVADLADDYDRAAADADHIQKMYQTQAEIYKETGNEESYFNTLKNQRDMMSGGLQEQRQLLAGLEAYAKSGTVTDPTAWDQLRQKILSAREGIAQTELEMVKLNKQVNQASLEKLMESFNRVDEQFQHEIKLEQYEQTRYQNNGELTNYGYMLGREQETQIQRRNALQTNIGELQKLLADAKANNDEETYYKITQEIRKEEEALAQVNNQIEKNTKLLEQNAEKIRQVRMALENEIVKEIKDRIAKEENMLNAEINLQNQLIDVIRKNYQERWNLIKKDIQKQQEALNKEKALINERLNARKNAQNQEDKWEELAEYQRQLALIAMDPSRTKDVKELQRKIEDLQKELSWEIADQEVASAQEAIDDEIAALNDYVTAGEEDLNEFLADANNFQSEVNDMLSFSITAEFDEEAYARYIKFMQATSKSYQNSTEETRKKMENDWRKTWLSMQGLAETYWEDEDFIGAFSNRESFLDYMKQSDEYRDASDTGRESMLYKWGELYDNYTKSLINDATFDDSHATFEAVTDIENYVYSIDGLQREIVGDLSDIIALIHNYTGNNDTTWEQTQGWVSNSAENYLETVNSNVAELDEYGDLPSDKPPKPSSGSGSGSGGSGGGGAGGAADPKAHYSEAIAAFYENGKLVSYAGKGYGATIAAANSAAMADAKKKGKGTFFEAGSTVINKYANGGLVDYTGPAWVDGTKSQPEAFLDAYDTKAIQDLTDVLSYVYVSPGVLPTADVGVSNNTNVGDIYITINQAELKDDADYDEVAKRIGQAFTKQMSKNGLNLAGYAF